MSTYLIVDNTSYEAESTSVSQPYLRLNNNGYLPLTTDSSPITYTSTVTHTVETTTARQGYSGTILKGVGEAVDTTYHLIQRISTISTNLTKLTGITTYVGLRETQVTYRGYNTFYNEGKSISKYGSIETTSSARNNINDWITSQDSKGKMYVSITGAAFSSVKDYPYFLDLDYYSSDSSGTFSTSESYSPKMKRSEVYYINIYTGKRYSDGYESGTTYSSESDNLCTQPYNYTETVTVTDTVTETITENKIALLTNSTGTYYLAKNT